MYLCLTVLFCGCKANYPVAQQSGKEDIAYLLFVSQKELGKTTVYVTLDNGNAFEAKTVTAKKSNRRGTSYAVGTGRRKIEVTHHGKVIYNKELFLSPQETKNIILP